MLRKNSRILFLAQRKLRTQIINMNRMSSAKLFALSMVIFAFLDSIWIGQIMANRYKLNADGSSNINFMAAVGVYALLAAAIVFFVLPRSGGKQPHTVFLFGALMGCIIYGVYDLTNAATLSEWPLSLILADMAWGTIATGLTALVVTNLGKMFRWV
jgi:uncharacterized membrane protein